MARENPKVLFNMKLHLALRCFLLCHKIFNDIFGDLNEMLICWLIEPIVEVYYGATHEKQYH